MDEKKDLAELAFDSVMKKHTDFPDVVPTKRIYFTPAIGEPCITDDSGYIPLDQTLARLERSGAVREMYDRMIHYNNSADKVINDYTDFNASDKLTLLQRIRDKTVSLNSAIQTMRSEKEHASNSVIKPPSVTTSAEPSVTVDNPS